MDLNLAFDKEANPIDVLRWGELNRDREYSQIGLDNFSGIHLSTVWLGLNHSHTPGGPPIIFETMFFGGPLDCWTVGRYATEDEAKLAHASIVESFHNGEAWAIVLEAARQLEGRQRHGWVTLARGYRRHYRTGQSGALSMGTQLVVS